jgi:copper resistance protein C
VPKLSPAVNVGAVRRTFLIAVVLVLSSATPALAHGALESSTPAPGAKVGRVPSRVVLEFSVAVTKTSAVKVIDGCGKQVAGHVAVHGSKVTAHLGLAEPGRWKVFYNATVAADGDRIADRFGFKVSGRPRCKSRGANESGETHPDHEVTTGNAAPPARPVASPAADGEGFPVVALLAATAAVAGLGIAASRIVAPPKPPGRGAEAGPGM